MKRGRPSIRRTISTEILNILSSNQTPLTTTTVTKQISSNLNRKISWNTVQKYLQELIELNKIQSIILPHSKKEGKEGLTVYMLKK